MVAEMKNIKTVLITGASRGIGRDMARAFDQKGYNVIINYNNSEKEAVNLTQNLNNAVAVRADISKENDVNSLFERAIEVFGSIDVLINNAGISCMKTVDQTTAADFDKVFGINVRGLFLCTQKAVKYMLKKHSGIIINISSIWGLSGASCESVYSASKAAVIGFTKALAKELGPSGIRVNAIAPGIIDTDMNKNIQDDIVDELKMQTPLMRIGYGSDIASLALYLADDSSGFITGEIIKCDGGFYI